MSCDDDGPGGAAMVDALLAACCGGPDGLSADPFTFYLPGDSPPGVAPASPTEHQQQQQQQQQCMQQQEHQTQQLAPPPQSTQPHQPLQPGPLSALPMSVPTPAPGPDMPAGRGGESRPAGSAASPLETQGLPGGGAGAEPSAGLGNSLFSARRLGQGSLGQQGQNQVQVQGQGQGQGALGTATGSGPASGPASFLSAAAMSPGASSGHSSLGSAWGGAGGVLAGQQQQLASPTYGGSLQAAAIPGMEQGQGGLGLGAGHPAGSEMEGATNASANPFNSRQQLLQLQQQLVFLQQQQQQQQQQLQQQLAMLPGPAPPSARTSASGFVVPAHAPAATPATGDSPAGGSMALMASGGAAALSAAAAGARAGGTPISVSAFRVSSMLASPGGEVGLPSAAGGPGGARAGMAIPGVGRPCKSPRTTGTGEGLTGASGSGSTFYNKCLPVLYSAPSSSATTGFGYMSPTFPTILPPQHPFAPAATRRVRGPVRRQHQRLPAAALSSVSLPLPLPQHSQPRALPAPRRQRPVPGLTDQLPRRQPAAPHRLPGQWRGRRWHLGGR